MTTRVKIKTWDAMEKEFGLDTYGGIQCEATFTSGMRPFAGTTIEVEDHGLISARYTYDTYSISKDMIESTEPKMSREAFMQLCREFKNDGSQVLKYYDEDDHEWVRSAKTDPLDLRAEDHRTFEYKLFHKPEPKDDQRFSRVTTFKPWGGYGTYDSENGGLPNNIRDRFTIVIRRDGSVDSSCTGYAFAWGHEGIHGDIVSYCTPDETIYMEAK